jgi:hypothetical protein
MASQSEDIQNGNIDVLGGIVIIDNGTNLPTNLRQATSNDALPVPNQLKLEGVPTLVMGVHNTGVGGGNILSGINCETDTNGKMRLYVDVLGTVALSGGTGLSQPNASQTIVPPTYLSSGNVAHGTLYTVPVGKTFYLTGIIVMNTTALTSLEDNAGSTYFYLQGTATNPTQSIISTNPIAVYTQNQLVKISISGSTGNAVLAAFGYLV